MDLIEIEIEPRNEHGTRSSRRIRRSGFIPSIVYSRGEGSVSAQVPLKAFVMSASQVKKTQLFSLKSSAPSLNGRSALVKDIQREFLSGNVLHVDFQALHDNEEIDVGVPLRFVGEAYGVKTDGGILSINAHEVTVSCLPKSIPSEFSVDITELKIGDSIHARALVLPEGVRLRDDGDETLVSVVAVRQTVTAEAAPGAADATAAAAGTEGAAAAAATPAATPEKGK